MGLDIMVCADPATGVFHWVGFSDYGTKRGCIYVHIIYISRSQVTVTLHGICVYGIQAL